MARKTPQSSLSPQSGGGANGPMVKTAPGPTASASDLTTQIPSPFTYDADAPIVQICQCCESVMFQIGALICEDGQEVAVISIRLIEHDGQRFAVIDIWFMASENEDENGEQRIAITQTLRALDGNLVFEFVVQNSQINSDMPIKCLSKEEAFSYAEWVCRINDVITLNDNYLVPFVIGTWPPALLVARDKQKRPVTRKQLKRKPRPSKKKRS